MHKPDQTEYAPYYQTYINQVQGDDIFTFLQNHNQEIQRLISFAGEEKGNYAYQAGKWTVKEVMGHLTDTERVFSYRAMCIARGEQQPLPGFEQNEYVSQGNFNSRSLSSIADEFQHLRSSNIALFKSFSDAELIKKGTASNFPVSVRALVFITAGHTEHHLNILKDRYDLHTEA